MKRYYLIIIFLVIRNFSYSQIFTTNPIITTEIIGKFLITTHDSIEIVVKLDKVKYQDSLHQDFPDADVSIRIENSKNDLIYIRNLPSSNNKLLSAEILDLNGIGNALVLIYDMFPCYGKGCERFQVLGFNDLGYFVPFTGFIDLESGKNPDLISNIKSRWLNNDYKEVEGKIHKSYFEPDYKLYLEMYDYYILWDIKVLTYYPILNDGIFSDVDYKESYFNNEDPIFYNNSNILNVKNIDRVKLYEPKYLYSKPNLESEKRIFYLNLASVIEIVKEIKSDEFWINLKIDGIEGYIMTNDLYDLGFNPCE